VQQARHPPCHLQKQNIEYLISALSRPLPEDRTLFSEVDMLLTEIRQCYMELNKFWTEEISRVSEALRMRRVEPADFERWRNFHANLKQTIDSWKVRYRFLFLCCALPTDQNTLFRTSCQVVMLKPYAATMHARLRSGSFSLPFWPPRRLTVRRKLTSGRKYPPCHPQWVRSHRRWTASSRATH
jgi:hypothetical protein